MKIESDLQLVFLRFKLFETQLDSNVLFKMACTFRYHLRSTYPFFNKSVISKFFESCQVMTRAYVK